MESQKQTGNNYRLGKTLKVLALFALVSSTLLTLSACGKKSGGSVPRIITPVAPIYPPGTCPTCGVGGGQTLFSAVGSALNFDGSEKMRLTLGFFAAGSAMTPYAGGYPGGAGLSYTGPAFATGVLEVYSNMTPLVCNIPPGIYSISPYTGVGSQQAQVTGLSIFSMTLQAVGPITILINLPNSWLISSVPAALGYGNQTFNYRFQGTALMYPQSTNCIADGYSNAYIVQ